jgi:hypothetical protein
VRYYHRKQVSRCNIRVHGCHLSAQRNLKTWKTHFTGMLSIKCANEKEWDCSLVMEQQRSSNCVISRVTKKHCRCYHSNRRSARFMKLDVVDVDDVGNICVVFHVGW